jgi:hypothetical protein
MNLLILAQFNLEGLRIRLLPGIPQMAAVHMTVSHQMSDCFSLVQLGAASPTAP